MEFLAGHVFTDRGFRRGYVGIEDGRTVAVAEGKPPATPLAEGVVLPAPINMHTHAGDAFLRPRPIPRDLERVVKPPDGLKHRWLRDARPKEVQAGMAGFLAEAERAGTAGIVDFREGGVEGARLLRDLAPDRDFVRIYGRPAGMGYDEREVRDLLDVADGIGISSVSDLDRDVVSELRDAARQRRRGFALHASEAVREPIDRVLDLGPDFVVHMCKGTREDFREIASAAIPIVVCPRASAHWGLEPPVPEMLAAGCSVALGTDNGMLCSPDLWTEIRALQASGGLTDDELLKMGTFAGWKALNRDSGITPLRPGERAAFVVFKNARNPYASVLGPGAEIVFCTRGGTHASPAKEDPPPH